jgi:hypothetical protein
MMGGYWKDEVLSEDSGAHGCMGLVMGRKERGEIDIERERICLFEIERLIKHISYGPFEHAMINLVQYVLKALCHV